MSSEEVKDKSFVNKVVEGMQGGVHQAGEVLQKAADATILHPAVVEGLHTAVDATILNPRGTNIDGAINLDGKLAKDAIDATILDMSPHGTK